MLTTVDKRLTTVILIPNLKLMRQRVISCLLTISGKCTSKPVLNAATRKMRSFLYQLVFGSVEKVDKEIALVEKKVPLYEPERSVEIVVVC